jgi:hypothetical protein
MVKMEHRFVSEGLYMIRSNGRRVNYTQSMQQQESFQQGSFIEEVWIVSSLPMTSDWYKKNRMVLIIPGSVHYCIHFHL